MSLLPIVLKELVRELRRPPQALGRIYDQHFGLGLEDLNMPAIRSGYLRPWRNLDVLDSGISDIKSDDKEFSVRLDVNHFKPDDLKVSLDDDGYVKVEGSHEEKSDEHGYISRQFIRRYKLPEDTLPETLASKLSSDGVLILQATKKPKEIKPGREIKIEKINQPALKNEEKEETLRIQEERSN